MAKRAAEGDISDRPVKRARTAEELRQEIGEYIITIPAEVLALMGLSVVDLASVADVSHDWRRAVFTLLLSTQHGKDMRSKMGLSEDDVVTAIDNDTFVSELRMLARIHHDFTNLLSRKPVAMVDTVLHYLRDGLITGPDRYEQAYDLILRLTRIATMLAVKQLFKHMKADIRPFTNMRPLMFCGVVDHATGLTHAVEEQPMPSKHPVFDCLGLNAHAIRIAFTRSPPPPIIDLMFWFDPLTGPACLRFDAFNASHCLTEAKEQEFTLMSMPGRYKRRMQVDRKIPLARLLVHDMQRVGGTRCSFRLSIRHINVDAILSTISEFDEFEVYNGLAANAGLLRPSLPTLRRHMIGMPERLVAAFDFMSLGQDGDVHSREPKLIGQTDTPSSPVIDSAYVQSCLALAKDIKDAYLRSEDIDMLFDAYNMWQHTVDDEAPPALRRRWLPSDFPAPRRRSDGTLHRTFWRSPLIQCATCPAEVVTHVSVNGASHEGRCAACVSQQ